MSSYLYRLNTNERTAHLLEPKPMASLGRTEPGDLEAWLASCKSRMFSRNILWLTRQDILEGDQRSDIVGLSDAGDLVIAELKRGIASPDVITQVLRYAAEYEPRTADDLAELYHRHGAKESSSALVDRANTLDEARARISGHVKSNEINESQVLVVLSEGYDDKVLSISDYLTKSVLSSTFSLELWKYSIHQYNDAAHDRVLLVEQVLPPPTIREQIETGRQEARSQKWLRDPGRMNFVRQLKEHLSSTPFPLVRGRGASYSGLVHVLGEDLQFSFDRYEDHPTLYLPESLTIEPGEQEEDIEVGRNDEFFWIEFVSVAAANPAFTSGFGDRFVEVVGEIKQVTPVGQDT